MNKLKARNTIYNDPMYDVVVDSRMLEQHLKEKNQQITDLQSQLAITEKALELACEPRDDWGGEKYSGTEYDNYYDYFMAEAKEMLENEQRKS